MSGPRLFVANWKMNLTRPAARAYAKRLAERIGASRRISELVVAPPFTALQDARDAESRWSLAAQNVAAFSEGAYTGEVSAGMVAEAGCRYVLVGHSERRRLFGETPAVLAAKLARTRESGLIPIYCLGETQEERAAGREEEILAVQVETLAADPAGEPLVVAYEPIWAIGTGQAATAADAAKARAILEGLLVARASVRLLYGGSVSPKNAEELLDGSGMDGFLIGGASLDPDGFATIAGL